jgi:nicotinamide phosphoribosyltransferase
MDYMPRREPKQKYPGELLPGTRTLECPLTAMADSYKAGHHLMYPDAVEMSAYGEFRKPFQVFKDKIDPGLVERLKEQLKKDAANGMKTSRNISSLQTDSVKEIEQTVNSAIDKTMNEFSRSTDLINDSRIVFYGLRYYIQQFLTRGITEEDIRRSEKFYSEHNMGGTPVSFPKKLFSRIEELGYFPVKIQALPEGTVIYPHTPVFIITASNEFSTLCTFLETMLTMVWYPSCVATLSRHTKTKIQSYYKEFANEKDMWLLNGALHDFGFRGCTSIEQSVLGGSAHLLNFTGSDTMSAAYHVQFHMNNGNAVAHAPAATEHSVMTSWPEELDAMKNLIEKFPGQVKSCVMDSYNYYNALEKLLPQLMESINADTKGSFVIRPDSGDPVTQVTFALNTARGLAVNKTNSNGQQQTIKFEFENRNEKDKKYLKFKNLYVIQGDGIGYQEVDDILRAVVDAGFSPANVAFGMGGGLLQKVNRDTMSFATKLSYIKYKDGKEKEIMKVPEDQPSKWSLPGKMFVCRKENEIPHVYPREFIPVDGLVDAMITVYDHGKVDVEYMSETFDTIKARVEEQWNRSSNKKHENQTGISYEMAYKQVMTAAGIHKWNNVKVINQLTAGLKKYNLSNDEKNSINEKLKQQCDPAIVLYDESGEFVVESKVIHEFQLRTLDPVVLDVPRRVLRPLPKERNGLTNLNTDYQSTIHTTLHELDRLLDSAVSHL